MKRSYPELVAQTLIDQLAEGTAPLVRPWRPGERFMPYNPVSGRNYRGINAIWLMLAGARYSDARWLTFRQALSLGGHIRRGEKGTVIQYWKWREEHPLLDEQGQSVRDENGDPVKVISELEHPCVFSSVVFNAEQADGLPPPPQRLPPPEWQRHEIAEQMLSGLGVSIRHISRDRAFYNPRTDTITLPERSQFPPADNYYAIALHEGAHAVGHPRRLDRDLTHPFGSPGYAREEMRAEIASMILGEELGIGYDPGQHAAYVGHWIKILQDAPLEVFRAASDAEKIVRFMRQLVPQLCEDVSQDLAAAMTPKADREGAGQSQERASERIYISVPYAKKDEAKGCGAKWDRRAKSWYIPEGAAIAPFERWPKHNLHSASRDIARDPHKEFAGALQAAGLILKGLPVMDGKLHRIPVEGDKRGARSGAYAGFLDGHPAGFIQNFKTGEKRNWQSIARGAALNDEDRRRLQRDAVSRRIAQEVRRSAIHQETIGLLAPYLDKLAPAARDHPYLQSKGVGQHGIGIGLDQAGPLKIPGGENKPQFWSAKGHLIIPMHTIDGKIVGWNDRLQQ